MTNVVCISRVKNEADIVEAWARHTLTHVDRIVVSDNDSSDDTVAILKSLIAEGLAIELRHEKTIGDYQARVFTAMMRDVADAGAQWVCPLDTDEFIDTEPGPDVIDPVDRDEGRTDRPRVWPRFADLLMAGPLVVRAIPWCTQAWTATDDQNDINPATRMRQRLVEESFYEKVSVPRAIALKGELAMGSHTVAGQSNMAVPNCRLAHLPLRSVDQYRLKGVIAYLQSAALPGWRGSGNSFQFCELPNAMNIEEQALTQYSRHYCSKEGPDWEAKTVDAPINYRGGALRYTKKKDRFMSVLLKHADAMAMRICELVAEKGKP